MQFSLTEIVVNVRNILTVYVKTVIFISTPGQITVKIVAPNEAPKK